ncbi:MAG TPA: division/cell wall cluster transcriptional repressor MraZ [Bacilli bacterium]|nr:division/cell wall cluster transcriptional repressor MraZ [Bacilli bacterium]
MKFYGTYSHNLDNKGRLVVPARFREALKEEAILYLMHGFDGALSVYPKIAFEKEVAFIESLNYRNAEARTYARIVLSSIEPLPVDAAGRVTIPAKILKKYNIGAAVTVIGVGTHLEIWDEAHYELYQAEKLPSFESVASKLGEKDE